MTETKTKRARYVRADGVAVELDLDKLIQRRHAERLKTEPERPAEDAWRAAERMAAAERDQRLKYNRLAVEEHLRGVYLRRYHEKDARVVELGGTTLATVESEAS